MLFDSNKIIIITKAFLLPAEKQRKWFKYLKKTSSFSYNYTQLIKLILYEIPAF